MNTLRLFFVLVAALLLAAARVQGQTEDGDVLDADNPNVADILDELDRQYQGGGSSGATGDQDQQETFDENAVSPFNTHLTYLFPEAPFLNIESGKYSEILVGVTNTAKDTLMVRTVEASFRYPLDMSQIIQNFTVYKYDVEIGANEQATVSYKIPIGPVFQPIDIGLVVVLTFETPNNKYFQMAAFNGTVNLVDPVRTFDIQAIFLYLFGVGVLAASGYAIYNAFFAKRIARASGKSSASASSGVGSAPSSSSSSAKTETGTTAQVDLDWIPVQNIKKSPAIKPRTR